jgi:hypothetical protein
MKILKPNKYTDINLSVIGLGAHILRSLKNNPQQKYEILLGKIVSSESGSAKENFLLSLNFLYSLGMINYHPEQDVVELNSK